MKNINKKLSLLLFISIILMLSAACGVSDIEDEINIVDETSIELEESLEIIRDEYYSAKDEVALYLRLYEELPDNYITKKEARELGWDSKAGNLWEVAGGMSIGGDTFGNREGILPDKKGRQYYECDINYNGGYRGAERIVYSNDGLIYYTEDHYKTFNLMYGEE